MSLKSASPSLSLSYPYSEEYTKPTQYMNTRCPAWCDRILMSHTAQEFVVPVSLCIMFAQLDQTEKHENLLHQGLLV